MILIFKVQYIFFGIAIAIIQSICSALFLGYANCPGVFFLSQPRSRGNAVTSPGPRDARATPLDRSTVRSHHSRSPMRRRRIGGYCAASGSAATGGRAPFPCRRGVVLSQKLIDRKRVPAARPLCKKDP